MDTDTEACTSKSGSTLAEELYLLKREQSSSQKGGSSGAPKSPMDSDNTEKILHKPMSTFGRKGKKEKYQGQAICIKTGQDSQSQSKSTSDKSSSSKSALAEARKKDVRNKSFESKAHDESLSLTERICRKQFK